MDASQELIMNVPSSAKSTTSKQTKNKSKAKKVKEEIDNYQQEQLIDNEETLSKSQRGKATKSKQKSTENAGLDTKQTPNKTPKKKPSRKSTSKTHDAKSDPCTPSTSKQSTIELALADDEGDDGDSENVMQEGSVALPKNLPDYAAKFGIEQVKLDRFKLDIPHTNLQYVVIDEICLEGLDGITTEALWTRISITIKQPLPFPDTITNFMWNIIRSRKEIEFYKLQSPRPKLVIFDRYQNSDPDIGAAMDPAKAPFDIYPYHPVKEEDVLGSAVAFHTRENVSDEVRKLTLLEAELRYGSQLVMVATQKLRAKAIMNPQSDPNIEFTPAQYCLLERIGRSRRLGETTQGKVSLQIICKDPKIIFYTRKILGENRLISKQPFYMKSAAANQLSGSLLHIMRFYNEKKTKSQIMTEQVVEVLRNRPSYRMEYSETKKVFGNLAALNKLFKLPDFQRFVRTDVQLMFRELYPNAPTKDWKLKGNGKERKVRTIELINPNVNIGGTWNEEEPKEESSDEDDTKEIIYNSPIIHQIYNFIRAGGPEGRTLKQVQANKGMDFYSVRAAVNQLVNQNLIVGVKIDIGRQRIIKYHTCHFHSNETEDEPTSQRQDTEALELQKQSLDFLSELLEVEPEFLDPGPCSHEEVNVPNSSPGGSYALIRRLRQQNKKTKGGATKSQETHTLFLNQERLKTESIANMAEDAHMEQSPVVDASQKDFNSSVLEKIFKNQHGYSTQQSDFSICNEYENYDFINSGNQIKELFHEMCNSTHSTEIGLKTRKRRKIHKRLLLSIKQMGVSDVKESPPVEELLREIVCPLIFSLKDASSKLQYRQLCRKVTKLVTPILSHFKRKLKVLMPKQRYTYKRTLPKDKMAEFSKDHPLLSLVPDSSKPAPNSNSGLFDKLQLKRRADSDENDDNKRLRLDQTGSTNDSSVLGPFNIFMGPMPRLAYRSVDEDGIEIMVVVSTKPEEFDEPGSKYIKDNNATLRTLKRAHCILEAVRQEKVITNIRRLHKMIQTQDYEEGYCVKVDKKSIERIYTRLVRAGHIKILQVILKSGETTRSVTVVCEPSLDIQHSIVESVIEQLKMKFFISARKKVWDNSPPKPENEPQTFDTSKISYSVGELKQLSSSDSPYLYNHNIGKDYGHAPKFMRMRVLHEFLFHLLYNYPYGQEVSNVADMLEELEVTVEDDVIREMPRVYCKEVSWKMFIPPLPQHAGWPTGWALVCDVLLRLPLSLFVKLYNVSYVIPELPMYLEHPVKQYYLVKQLPSDIRNGILHRRRYIFSIHETLARLCYIGILQFGPQKLKEKDQLFIYLNRNATLLDTTTSNAGYHYVQDKEYKKLHYHFASTTDVETYWYEMWNICAHSKLGLRNTVTGTYITIEQAETKPALIEAMKAQSPQSAELNDDGHVPGDGRGAGGLDSALWSHIKRNWICCNRVMRAQSKTSVTVTSSKKRKVDSKKQKKLVKSKGKAPRATTKEDLLPLTETQRRTYKKPKHGQAKSSTCQSLRRGKSYVRKVLHRVDMKQKRDYDSIDKKLMEDLKQSRSEWHEEEDKVLHICKIVMTFLCPNFRKRSIPYTVIRDVLHKLSPCSTNKTSGACQRRLAVIFGISYQQEYLLYIVRTLHHIPYIRRYFQKLSDMIDAGKSLSDKQINGSFVYLAVYFFKHQHEIQHILAAISNKSQAENKSTKGKSDKGETFSIGGSSKTKPKSEASSKTKHDAAASPQARTNQYEPGPVEVIAYDCTELAAAKDKANKLYSQAATFPQTEMDVIVNTIKAIIHSTIGSRQDEISWIYQLFRVYQNYSDDMLKTALTEIRNSQMISLKRTYNRKPNDVEALPITTKFFQFSFHYYITQITKFPPELFQEAHEVFLGVVKHKESILKTTGSGLPMECFAQGHSVGLAEIAVDVDTHFSMDIPNEVLILNPNITDHTELIRELAVRYKKMLTLVKEGTYFNNYDNDDNNHYESVQNGNPDTSDEVDFTKQPKLIPRTPMIQRFLKSWFLAEELDEVIDDEDTDKPQTSSSNVKEIPANIQVIKSEVAIGGKENKGEDSDRKGSAKLERKRKRPNQMTSEESKKILESLNPQLQLAKHESHVSSSRVTEKPTQSADESPVAANVPNLSFEDYERKLESLLSSKVPDNYTMPLEVTLQESQGEVNISLNESSQGALVDVFDDSNILQKYLYSKRHLTGDPAGVAVIDYANPAFCEKHSGFENERNFENTDSDPITSARIQYLMDDELTVEQIMTEMLVECPPEDRKVPKPISLARLLVKGLFPELDEDEERLERLHQHFLIICPDTNISLSDFEDSEEFRYLYLEHMQTCKQLLRKVQMDIITNENFPTIVDLSNKLKSLGGTDLDIFVAESLIDFVHKKRVIGASMSQLKEHFSNLENLKLSTILQTLTSMNFLLRTGINYIVYVHLKFRKPWLVESCTLEDRDRLKLKESKLEEAEDVDLPTLAKSLESYTEIKVKIMPWARIDGTLNLKVFEKWMCTVLSNCLSDMLVPLTSVIQSCGFLKPVEVYYLVECLQELGCVQMLVYEWEKPTLFSQPSYVEPVPADITDAFENIYIETDELAVIKFGTLVNKKLKEFDFPSDEAKKHGTF